MEHAQEFAWIAWSPAEIEQHATNAIAAKEAAYAALKGIPAATRTFANTIAALEYASNSLADLQQTLDVLLSVHPDLVLRDAAHAAHERIESAQVTFMHDRGIWQAVQEWLVTGERSRLDATDGKLVDDLIRDLRRTGFQLPDAEFGILLKKRQELQRVEAEFERAINEWDDGIEVTRDQLNGLPERYIAGLERTADGHYRITLKYPDLFPFLEQAHADAPRRELAAKNLQKGGKENMERLAHLVTLRQDIAGMLGYATHADDACEIRMAKTGATATQFIEHIIEQLRTPAHERLQKLAVFKRESLGATEPTPLAFHELAYWSHRLYQEKFGLDTELIKQYFPLPRVMEGMMRIYQELLGIRFTPLTDAVLWHPDAQAYAVYDAHEGRLIGRFILDLYPRPGKYGHAAAFPLRLGRQEPEGTSTTGLVALVCNFSKPSADAPSLLEHQEVETLLHEFGHAMHALLSTGRWQGQNGFGTPLDFIEAISQMFEYWAWHPAGLARISGHWQTGKTLPDDLLAKMLTVRTARGPRYYLSQAVRALYDLRIHGAPTAAPVITDQLAQLYRTMKSEYEEVALPDDSLFPAGWGHMADYDAGYYSYLWSKVYAADMFTKFAAEPLSTTIGARYRREVLEPGASRHELDLVRAFLEREPSSAAFLAELGIS